MELKLLIAGIIVFVVARLMKRISVEHAKPLWKKIYHEAYEWIETGWSAILLASFIMYFFLQAFKIPSGSMRMTLLEGDHLFVNKFIYGIRVPYKKEKRLLSLKQPKRGDIIVFEYPNDTSKDYIKRCMGLPGDIIEVKEKKLYINGKMMDEPYVVHKDPNIYANEPYISKEMRERDNFGPIVVPKDEYFCMGDNRDYSSDSRFWGPLPKKYLKGGAMVVYWPPSRIGVIK